MKPILHVVELDYVPIFQQLQWEEALLRADNRNWCLINHGSLPAIVMGISGKMDQLIYQEKLKTAPLPVIRRFSGGGTVVVDENTLFVTFICQSDALNIAPFPSPIMQWTAELYRPLFPSYPFQLRENDYVFGEKKWGGNAQSIIKGRWLHHSSLLWNYHADYMDYLLMPAKTPLYRQGRPHTDFLCCLKDYCSERSLFQTQLLNQLNRYFNFVKGKKEEVQHVASSIHRKVTCLI